MRLSSALNRYLAIAFVRNVGLVFLAAFALLLLIDVMELARRAGDAGIPMTIILLISSMRLPALSEQLVPFAVLIGAIMTLVAMSRRSELIIARASGLSAWQFLVPLLLAAALIGMGASVLYNPVSATLKERSDVMLTERFGGTAANIDPEREVWFRQSTGALSTLVRAASATQDGQTLHQVTAMLFDANGDFVQRVDAEQAVLRDGVWRMDGVSITDSQGETSFADVFELATPLTPDDVLGRFTPATAVPIWNLPSLANKAQQAGIAADRYRFQFQALLARPMLLMAMVLVAATVSLRFSRHGGTTRLVVAGLSAGFIVFVINEISGDLGGAGLVSPILAAWVPPVAAGLFGITALLHLEDG
ncbi:MAG: LPS export ABC transporter permease LptG [Pseudomonadota bacterium]